MSTKSTGAVVNIRGRLIKGYYGAQGSKLVPEDEQEEDYYTLQRRDNGNPIYYIIPNSGDSIDDAVIVGRINAKGDVREWYGIPPMIRKIVKKIDEKEKKRLRQPRERKAWEIAYDLERQRKRDEEEEEDERNAIERARVAKLEKQEEQDYTMSSIQRLYDNDVKKYGLGMFSASFSGGGGGGDEPDNGSTIQAINDKDVIKATNEMFGTIIPEEPEEFYMTKEEIRELREEEERKLDPISATFDDVLVEISRSFELFERFPPTAEQLNATVQGHMSDLEGYLEEVGYTPFQKGIYRRQFEEVRRQLKELSEMPTEEQD